MIDTYVFVLIIHLLCGIIFIGFVFTDVVVLPVLKQYLSQEEFKKIKTIISSRARKIFPLSVLVLILSGGYMLSRYMNSEMGFLETNLQKLLFIKAVLALVIGLGILYSLIMRMLGKKPHPIMEKFHTLVLVLGVVIVVLAKVMFVV